MGGMAVALVHSVVLFVLSTALWGQSVCGSPGTVPDVITTTTTTRASGTGGGDGNGDGNGGGDGSGTGAGTAMTEVELIGLGVGVAIGLLVLIVVVAVVVKNARKKNRRKSRADGRVAPERSSTHAQAQAMAFINADHSTRAWAKSTVRAFRYGFRVPSAALSACPSHVRHF